VYYLNRWPLAIALLLGGHPSTWAQNRVDIDALNARAWELIMVKPMEAREYSIQAREWSEKIGYLAGTGDSYSTLGYLYCAEGAFEDGYRHYTESLRVRRADGDSTKVANVFINLSIFKNQEGRYDEARADASRAIGILEGLLRKERPGSAAHDKIAYSLGQAFLNLSNIYSDFHDNVLALEYARRGFRTHSTTENRLAITRAMKTLANRYYTAWTPKEGPPGYADSAKYFYTTALDYLLHAPAEEAELIGEQEVSDVYYGLAQIEHDQGNYHMAWDLLERAEQILNAMDAEPQRSTDLFYILVAKGKWFAAYKKDYKTALEYFRKAGRAEIFEAIDVSVQLELFNLISDAFAETGQRDSAYRYQKLAAALSTTYFNERQASFQDGERSDWQQKLNTEIAQSALVRERQRYLAVAVIALLLLTALIAVVAWGIVRSLRRRAAAANRKIEEMVGSLDAKYLEGIESEREEVAGILHDDLGGHSVANTWMIEALLERLPARSEEQELATRILQGSRQLSESIRAFSHRLSSIYVQRSGLVPALEELCRNISRGGRIQARLNVGSWEGKLDVSQEIQLLRILQELITNTVKYARAHEIEIVLGITGPDFYLRYADDGVGFDIRGAMDAGRGLGLENIRRRTTVLHGRLEAGSTPGAGMWVEIRFPFSPVLPVSTF
jgi:signal transduction histidine kinase